MQEAIDTSVDNTSMRTLKVLVAAGIVCALVAAGAGIVLLVASPDAGSRTEAALGLTAAIAGLATAAFAIAAAIYAQVKNLWQRAPTWVRVGAWALIAVAVIASVVSWLA